MAIAGGASAFAARMRDKDAGRAALPKLVKNPRPDQNNVLMRMECCFGDHEMSDVGEKMRYAGCLPVWLPLLVRSFLKLCTATERRRPKKRQDAPLVRSQQMSP